MALSVSQRVIVGKESTFGTPPASDSSTATLNNAALPVETASINLLIEPFNDQTKRGAASLDGNIYPTVRRAEGSLEGPFFTDECAYFILALLGTSSVATGASDQNTHSFFSKTSFAAPNANSLTIDVRDDAQDREFVGCYVSSFTLRFSAAEGIMTYSASIMSVNGSTTLTLANTAFAEPVPIFGWTGTVNTQTVSRTADNETVGSTTRTGLIDAEFTINRPTALTYVARNSQVAYRSDPGPLEVTARFTYDWDTLAGPTPADWFTDYTDAATHQRGWRFDLTNAQTGAAARMIRLYLPAASVLEGPLEVDRSETSIRANLALRAVHNSVATIAGPIKVKLTSRKATVYGT